MQIRKEVKIGLLVIVALVFLFWGYNFLRGSNIFNSGNTYYGVYSSVEGLNEGGPVFYRGYKVGSIYDISLSEEEPGAFAVTFGVQRALPVAVDAVAQIYSTDLLGSKAIQIMPGKDSEVLSSGSRIKSGTASDLKDQVTEEIIPLKEKAELLMARMDTVLAGVSVLFTDENKAGLEQAVKDFNASMYNLQRTTGAINQALADGGSINRSLSNLENFTEVLQQQGDNVGTSLENLAAFSEELGQLPLGAIGNKADSLLSALNEGEGSLGQLMRDETLYLNMNDAVANMDRLVVDVRQNPSRYLSFSAINFGRKVYITDESSRAAEKGLVFRVKLAESAEPLAIRNQAVGPGLLVEEIQGEKSYLYLVGETTSYQQAEELRRSLLEDFPAAEVYPLEDGEAVSLKRALRKVE
ncbi:MlaD family protein [Geofilum rhodophaeum]|uniref:MlaD family protein n=1 Tax=Geofilum rhodophaeum TaxID=1965019 RepID=UPI000B5230D0|nr:MlaD family protein [Geofilum rhodophaeum]